MKFSTLAVAFTSFATITLTSALPASGELDVRATKHTATKPAGHAAGHASPAKGKAGAAKGGKGGAKPKGHHVDKKGIKAEAPEYKHTGGDSGKGHGASKPAAGGHGAAKPAAGGHEAAKAPASHAAKPQHAAAGSKHPKRVIEELD